VGFVKALSHTPKPSFRLVGHGHPIYFSGPASQRTLALLFCRKIARYYHRLISATYSLRTPDGDDEAARKAAMRETPAAIIARELD
jgi:hypothetical protein